MYEILGSHGENFDALCLWDCGTRLNQHKISEQPTATIFKVESGFNSILKNVGIWLPENTASQEKKVWYFFGKEMNFKVTIKSY